MKAVHNIHPDFASHFPSATVREFRNDEAKLGGQKMCRSCGHPHVEGTDVVVVREPHDHMTFYYCIACSGRSDDERLTQFVIWGDRIEARQQAEVKVNGGKCLKCNTRKAVRRQIWCAKCRKGN